jgi:uncharacterized protein (TIGR02646 family)
MRYIALLPSGGPKDADENLDKAWLAEADQLLQRLIAAQDRAVRDAIIDDNDEVWKKLRPWLLSLSEDKCWYSEARDVFSVLEVEHYRPKKSLKRKPRDTVKDGYWWLTFDWQNYRICGKVGNSKKGVFFPLAATSLESTYGGLSLNNEIPLLLDPAREGDPELLSFNEDGRAVAHDDSDTFSKLRVEVTVERLNLDHGRLKKARQRIWNRCRQVIDECRVLALQMEVAAGPGDFVKLTEKKAELERMVQDDAEFSAVAKICLLKSNISWAMRIACR